MRSAVLAATLGFDQRLEWIREPLRLVARQAGGLVMRWLDHRREVDDRAS